MPKLSAVSIRPARRADLDLVLSFIRELASYERLSHEVVADKRRLTAAFFPRKGPPVAECLIAFHGDEPAGFAVFYRNFSTFVGLPGLFLEDLFVRPALRGRGIGKALWTAVARLAAERGCGRMDWLVLRWNRKAQRFYRSQGASHFPSWTLCRVAGDRLTACAGRGTDSESPKPPRRARRAVVGGKS